MLIDFHLYLLCFSNCEKTNFGSLRGRLGKDEIYNRNAARQTTENIIRIAQNSSVKVVQMVNILILARLFNVKLTCAKMFLKARPANSQIDRIVWFQFWWETSADFKYVGIVKCKKLSFWLIFIYICGVSTILNKLILDHLEVASESAFSLGFLR